MSNKDAERNSEHTLVLSSEYTSSGTTSSNTDFTVHLKNSSHGSLLAAQMVYAQIPNCFDNVREGLNSFNIYESSTDTTTTITVPPGRYSNNELRELLLTIFADAYPATPDHPVSSWISMTYEADNRFHLNVDMGGDEDFTGTFDAELLSEPMADLLTTQSVFPQNYIRQVVLGQDGVYDNSYVGMWMTVKQRCRLVGATTAAAQINPNPNPDPSHFLTCRIFTMVYTGPSVYPNVVPPSDYDLAQASIIRPWSDEFTMSVTSQSNYQYRYGNFTGTPQVIMEPGYYFIGYKQGFQNADGYGHGIDFDVAGAYGTSPIANVADIHELGKDDDIIQTRYNDNDPKKQPSLFPTFAGPGVKMTEIALEPPYGFYSNNPPRFLQVAFFMTTTNVPGGTAILSSPTAGSPDDLLTHVLGFANRQSVETAPHTIGHLHARATPNTSGPQTVFIRSTCFGEAKAMGPSNGEIVDTNIMGIVSLADVPWGSYSRHMPEDASTGLHRYRHTRNLSHVDFQITDIAGRVLSLPANRPTTLAVKLFMTKVF